MLPAMNPTTTEDPPLRSRDAILRERHRNHLHDMNDAITSQQVERATALLPKYAGDVMLRVLLHRIIATADDEIPGDLRARYQARRSEVAWLEDEVEVTGAPTDAGIVAVARLAVAARHHHRRLAAIFREKP